MAENYLTYSSDMGSINISEDVIAVMVAAAVAEVDGVSGLAGNAGSEGSGFFGKKAISKGIKVQFDDRISIDVVIMLGFGYPIAKTAEMVQDAVATAVESMTGMGVPVVNVHVGGVSFDKQ